MGTKYYLKVIGIDAKELIRLKCVNEVFQFKNGNELFNQEKFYLKVGIKDFPEWF